MMDKRKIIESGLLELYVMGGLHDTDINVVESAIQLYPDLKSELYSIEEALFLVAKSNAISPPPSLKADLLKKIKNQSKNDSQTDETKVPKGFSYFLPFILACLSAIGLMFAYFSSNSKYQNLESAYSKDKIACDSLLQTNARNQELLANLSSPSNKVLNVDPTEGYPNTRLIIHHNPESKKNYLQLDELPALTDNQSFQLWSLKDGVDPIPLDVFQGDQNLIEVRYVDGTTAYAITIEPLGGQATPTLANLIGVIAVES